MISPYETGYRNGIEAANAKFTEKFVPVIENAITVLKCELSWLETYPNPSNNLIDRIHDIQSALQQLTSLIE